jgi:nucleoside recognition membrane protein YjiH
VEAFYVIGSALAVLAVIVSAVGIMGKDFPGSVGLERAIGLVFAVMVIAAIGAAVIGSANEGEEEHQEETALVLPR